MTILEWLRGKARRRARPAGEAAHVLYGAIAAAARDPDFYTRHAIADTIDGRFDTVVLHAVLVLRRLKAVAGEAAREQADMLAQGVVDTMFADFDLSLHEMGVGDTKVGRKVKEMARAFLGRMEAYHTALDAGDAAALTAALTRNVYRLDDTDGGNHASAEALAEAVMATAASLAALPDDSLDAVHITRALTHMRGQG